MDSVYTERLDEHVAAVVLNQPAKKNAISAVMMDRLAEYLLALDESPDVRVVVLRGEGEVFSSGGDLSQTPADAATIETSRATLRHYLRAVRVLRHVATPVVAMVDGVAVGGAFSLALACDLVCVSDRVRVVPAFCALGIAPEMGIAQFLPQLVGEKLAKEILFTNRALDAAELRRLGIANRVLPAPDLAAGTLELARQVAAMSPTSIGVTKALVNRGLDVGLDGLLEAESTASPYCAQTADFAAAAARFARPTPRPATGRSDA